MLFRQLFDKESSTYTYLIAADSGQEAILIDPVLEKIPLYERLIKEHELKFVATLETHLHADHITASGPLREKYGSDIVMGEPCAAKHTTRTIRDNETLYFNGFDILCLHTPGHTDCSYCYLMDDWIFTGDTLFIRGTGRTDFQNGSPKDAYESLFGKLLKLPDQTLVYPGHDYSGQSVSTIGEEKRFNPRLQVHNANEYADIMDNLNLSHPQKMDIAIPANILCGLQDKQGVDA